MYSLAWFSVSALTSFRSHPTVHDEGLSFEVILYDIPSVAELIMVVKPPTGSSILIILPFPQSKDPDRKSSARELSVDIMSEMTYKVLFNGCFRTNVPYI